MPTKLDCIARDNRETRRPKRFDHSIQIFWTQHDFQIATVLQGQRQSGKVVGNANQHESLIATFAIYEADWRNCHSICPLMRGPS